MEEEEIEMQKRWWKPSRKVPMILLVSLLILLIVPQSSVSAINPPPSDLNMGPYVDELDFRVIENPDDRILAMQAGETELDTTFLDAYYFGGLGFEDPDIDIYSALRNGYGHITINCREYPLNISGLRRAFAYAFDKTAVAVDIMDGFSQEHDSIVPYTNGWCIEEEFEWNYYFAQPDIGNQILDDLGFAIDSESGFRLAPNGDPFDITILYPSTSPEKGGGIAQYGVDALHSLYIDAKKQASNWQEYYPNPIDYHESFDMATYETDFYDNDVDWLVYDYCSEYVDVVFQNPSNFMNSTYDSWKDQLLHGTTYEEVYEAASEMQKILHYNVPRLVVYEDVHMQAYRNDRYTGHVEDLARYITGPWTMRKIHKLDGTFGGSVPIALGNEPGSFNIYLSTSQDTFTILSELYSSLYKYGPDLNPWPDLATNLITETHSDNPSVPDGHTRFTIDILQNATWSDGQPLTAIDVAFTYTYLIESKEYGNPVGDYIADLVAVYAPNPYRVTLEFNTESYWHFSNFAFESIIPEHIFNDETGIGYDGWNTWNPVYDPTDPLVTSGPYLFSEFESGEYYKLVWNPRYYYGLENRLFLLRPSIPYVPDIVYVYGTLGNEITWVINDEDPVSYEVTMNGTSRISGNVTSDTISHNIDHLLPGHYVFTLSVTDSLGNIGNCTTQVYVLISPFHRTDGSINLSSIFAVSISGGSVVIILFVIVSLYKNERFDPYSKLRNGFYNSKFNHNEISLLPIKDENRKRTA